MPGVTDLCCICTVLGYSSGWLTLAHLFSSLTFTSLYIFCFATASRGRIRKAWLEHATHDTKDCTDGWKDDDTSLTQLRNELRYLYLTILYHLMCMVITRYIVINRFCKKITPYLFPTCSSPHSLL
jgi:hypothetical protein